MEYTKIARLLGRLAIGREIGFSFNLSDRCPLNCSGCYWLVQNRVKEMTDDNVVSFFEHKRQQGYLLATIVGGEPYVRKDLLPKVANILPATWVVTSGTTPLMSSLPRTTHFVSVDGVDAATHDQKRGSRGLFDRIIKNLKKVRSSGDFPVYIHCVLNSRNSKQIWEMCNFWSNNGLVDGVVFSTTTPITGTSGEYDLRQENIEDIVDDLSSVRAGFGKFVLNNPDMIDLLRPENMRHQNPSKCGVAVRVSSFAADGSKIKQCIMSEKADCSQCGCVITGLIHSATRFPPSWRNLRELGNLRGR